VTANVGPVQGLKGLSVNRPHARGVKPETLHDPTRAAVNELFAERAFQLAREHAPRSHARRAAAALWVALATTRTPAGARRALRFASPDTRAVAAALLDVWEAQLMPALDRSSETAAPALTVPGAVITITALGAARQTAGAGQ
jgi:hypothetical protein